MKQYMLSVWHSEGEPLPEGAEAEASFEATGKFNDEIVASGNWIFGGGLHAPEMATVVRVPKDGDVTMTDGPYAETKEMLGGFWVIQANDLDEALALAVRASKACANPVEVRPFHDDQAVEDMQAEWNKAVSSK